MQEALHTSADKTDKGGNTFMTEAKMSVGGAPADIKVLATNDGKEAASAKVDVDGSAVLTGSQLAAAAEFSQMYPGAGETTA